MKRYALFVFDLNEPNGGWDDFRGFFDDGNRYIEKYIAYLKGLQVKRAQPQPRPVTSQCAPAPTQVCVTTSQQKAHTLRTLLAIAATLSLCGCPDVAPMPTPSPSAVMPPRYVAPARDTATTQQMLKYYFVQ